MSPQVTMKDTAQSTAQRNSSNQGVPIVGWLQKKLRRNKHTREEDSSDDSSRQQKYSLLPMGGADTYGATEIKGGALGDDLEGNAPKKSTPWSRLQGHVQSRELFIRGDMKEKDNKEQEHFTDHLNVSYDFTLTDCFFAFLIYLVVSVIAYSFVFERWTIITSMYFAVVMGSTVGYGDLSPSTPGGRIFCCFFAIAGVAVLAIALGIIGSRVVEAQVKTIAKVEDLMVRDIMSLFRRDDKSKKEAPAPEPQERTAFSYLSRIDHPLYSLEEGIEKLSRPWRNTAKACLGFVQMLAVYVPTLLPLCIGAYIMASNEGWGFDETLYFTVITSSTIGFGDVTVQRESMKLFAVVFIPFAVGAMGHFLGTIANFIMEQRTQHFHKQLWKHELTVEDLESISDTGTVTELDFVIFMLQAMNKVDADLVDTIREHFRHLDASNNGTLDREDLKLLVKKRLRGIRSKLQLSYYKEELKRKAREDAGHTRS